MVCNACFVYFVLAKVVVIFGLLEFRFNSVYDIGDIIN